MHKAVQVVYLLEELPASATKQMLALLSVEERRIASQHGIDQRFELGWCRFAFNLRPVGFGHFRARLADTRLQPTVIRQQEESFAVVVEPACRVDARTIDVVSQCFAAFGIAELAEYAKRLVEEDQWHGQQPNG